jgi:hypothetical protein
MVYIVSIPTTSLAMILPDELLIVEIAVVNMNIVLYSKYMALL